MAKGDGVIERVGRGRLEAIRGGQIGQKERVDTQIIDNTEESNNLSNLSDLSGRTRGLPLLHSVLECIPLEAACLIP
jgi:hypothetical protein